MKKRPNSRHFLAEMYLPCEAGADELGRVRSRAHRGAQAATKEGTTVFYVSSAYLPQEEILFLLYDSDSTHAVESALNQAGLTPERVHEAVDLEQTVRPSVARLQRKEIQ
jgi:hypothetical protein